MTLTRKALFIFVLIGSSYELFAQGQPIFASYLFDRYMLNPSYIADNNYSQVNLVHRRIWTGIDDAPVISGINAQYAKSPKLGFGLTFLNDQRILQSRNTILSTIGYKVFLSELHTLQFGLSGGVSFNQLEIDDISDPIDPALAGLSSEKGQLQGQFGLSYRYKNFTLGFTLPRLFQEEPFSDTAEDLEFSEFDNMIVNASTIIPVSSEVALEPYGLYNLTDDDFDFYELGINSRIKNMLSLGLFYRENRGIGFITQISISNIDVAYAFEDGSNQNLSFAGSTHELQLKLRLGKKVTRKASVVYSDVSEPNTLQEEVQTETARDETNTEEPEGQENIQAETPVIAKEDVVNTEKEAVEVEPIKSEKSLLIEEKEDDDTTVEENLTPIVEAVQPTESNDQLNNTPNYYIVAGAFKEASNADKFLNSIKDEYPESGKVFIEANDLHYVFLRKVKQDLRTLDELTKIRSQTRFTDAWFMKER